jgi:hypothetical protein
MLVKVRPKPAYQQNLERSDGGPVSNYQMFCAKVLDHSWKIENQILLSKLNVYKEAFGYIDLDPPAPRQKRTLS